MGYQASKQATILQMALNKEVTKKQKIMLTLNFRSLRWGSSLSAWCTCLQSHLLTSRPTAKNSYPKFRNPKRNF